MMNLIRASIAMAAFVTLFILPSIAYGVVLTYPTGTAAPVGTKLLATTVAHANTSRTVILKTGLGNVECETGEFTGELTKNSGGVVEEEITTIEYRGKSGQITHGSTCFGGFGGDTTVTPNHATNPCHTPAGGSATCALPRCLKVEAEDKVTIRGGKCSEAARPLMFTLDTTTIGACTYRRLESYIGTYTTHPADTVLTFVSQKIQKVTGSVFCPSTGEIFMAFTMTIDNEGVGGEPIYLDK